MSLRCRDRFPLLDAIHELVQATAWSHWRKDQLIEVLVEAQLIIKRALGLPDGQEIRQRFTAALKIFANC
jgi:hypothetical protein